MSGIQSILAIGAIWLFALVSINFNSSVVHNISIEVENKVYLTAFSLADDMIEEIKQKAFDERNIGEGGAIVLTPDVTQLSLPPLGRDGETHISEGFGPPYLDDVDDYNGYTKNIGLPYLETYSISVNVFYVNGANPGQVSNTQTFYKKVEVTVDSKYIFPVVLSFIFTMK
jgi:hypothetical protein